jgi:hypothetical protein
MESNAAPTALREQLGSEATHDLVRMFDTARAEWTAEVVSLSLERFERRLIEELAGLRIEMAGSQATLREDMAQQSATLREKLAQQGAALRGEIAAVRTDLKSDMQEGFATIRQEMATNRFELLKWSFLFWIGQVLAIVGLVGAMLRALGPVR